MENEVVVPVDDHAAASYGLKAVSIGTDECAMLNLAFGYICILVGGTAIGYELTKGISTTAGSYAMGPVAGVGFGVALFAAGWLAVLRGSRSG
jgi:Mn2+/Fe2+ NRAMP family transporter